MKNLRAKFAAVVVAAAAFTALPLAANAAGVTQYPDAQVVSGPATLAPGASGTYTFAGFEAGEQVTFTLTGEGIGPANLAIVKAAPTSTTEVKTAAADGTASAVVTLPTNATGVYTLTADSASTDPASVTITLPAGAGGLPATGIDAASMTGVWIGGGALLAAGIAVTSVAMIRRRQAEQA